MFYGGVTGSGRFTGAGAVYFEGDLLPGNSPANVVFEGDLHLTETANVVFELGGLLAGTQYDQLTVFGDTYLDGALTVNLLDGFMPSGGEPLY